MLTSDYVPVWCWHSATEVPKVQNCRRNFDMATPSPLQETKMVVPSDPNGQQFSLPGEAGELRRWRRWRGRKTKNVKRQLRSVFQAPLAHTLPTFLWPGAAFVVGGQVDKIPNVVGRHAGMLLVSGDGSNVRSCCTCTCAAKKSLSGILVCCAYQLQQLKFPPMLYSIGNRTRQGLHGERG